MTAMQRPLAFAALIAALIAALVAADLRAQGALVLQSDFGTRDGAVASMKGVALGVDPALRIIDLTHQIEPFDIWEAAYRLRQVTPFWALGTVFVSIVDPGVGTERRGIVARTATGQLIVTPDNGTLTLLAGEISEVREIDMARQRLPGRSARTPSTAATSLPTSGRALPRARSPLTMWAPRAARPSCGCRWWPPHATRARCAA